MRSIPEWIQSALFEADVIEVHAWVGWISDPEHVQIQVETRDPISGNLLDLMSMPHCEHADLQKLLLPMFLNVIDQLRRNVVHTSSSLDALDDLYLKVGALQRL